MITSPRHGAAVADLDAPPALSGPQVLKPIPLANDRNGSGRETALFCQKRTLIGLKLSAKSIVALRPGAQVHGYATKPPSVAAKMRTPPTTEKRPTIPMWRLAIGTAVLANRLCHCHGTTSRIVDVTSRTQPRTRNGFGGQKCGEAPMNVAPSATLTKSSMKCRR